MNIIDELTEHFRKFPGIGPRQAERFVYFLLRQDSKYINDLSKKISELHDEVAICSNCYKHFISKNKNETDPQNILCEICKSQNRDSARLMVVSSDADLKSIEKSGVYNGLYFVLGGSVPINWSGPEKIIRLKPLEEKIKNNATKIEEIILALSANPAGENTAEIIKKSLNNLIKENDIKLSILGRGLSTGTEIEYSDSETIKNALKNRF